LRSIIIYHYGTRSTTDWEMADFRRACNSAGRRSFNGVKPSRPFQTAGLVIVLVGALLMVLSRVGLFKLPGDLQFGSKNWRVYLPIASCIIISIVLTFILWLIHYFRR
jgi:hypothetical protein